MSWNFKAGESKTAQILFPMSPAGQDFIAGLYLLKGGVVIYTLATKQFTSSGSVGISLPVTFPSAQDTYDVHLIITDSDGITVKDIPCGQQLVLSAPEADCTVTVVDAGNDAPIAGATVVITTVGVDQTSYFPVNPNLTFTKTTDASGVAAFTGLTSGLHWSISVSASGYTTPQPIVSMIATHLTWMYKLVGSIPVPPNSHPERITIVSWSIDRVGSTQNFEAKMSLRNDDPTTTRLFRGYIYLYVGNVWYYVMEPIVCGGAQPGITDSGTSFPQNISPGTYNAKAVIYDDTGPAELSRTQDLGNITIVTLPTPVTPGGVCVGSPSGVYQPTFSSTVAGQGSLFSVNIANCSSALRDYGGGGFVSMILTTNTAAQLKAIWQSGQSAGSSYVDGVTITGSTSQTPNAYCEPGHMVNMSAYLKLPNLMWDYGVNNYVSLVGRTLRVVIVIGSGNSQIQDEYYDAGTITFT